MNWTDFMIAIRRGLIPSKKELVDGTTKVGNADKLDGHDSGYFAQGTNGVANHASKLVQIHGGSDLLEFALTVQPMEVVTFLTGGNTTNIPTGGAYSQGMIYRRSEDTIDILLFARSTGKVWHNAYKGTAWTGWQSLANDADLAKYLPLSGGTLTAQHYLPLGLKNANGNNSYVQFEGKDGALGYLGFESANTLRLLSSVGGSLGDILHSGNSAKTAIQESAPSDTNSLWVW